MAENEKCHYSKQQNLGYMHNCGSNKMYSDITSMTWVLSEPFKCYHRRLLEAMVQLVILKSMTS